MPELRTIEGRERLRAPIAVTYDSDRCAKAAAQRRRRRGRNGPVPVEIRNGLPWKPYVYGGTGVDQLTGGDDDA